MKGAWLVFLGNSQTKERNVTVTARMGERRQPLQPLLLLILCAVLPIPAWAQESSSARQMPQVAQGQPLSLVLLVDSSGSMKETDPKSLRIAAAQSVVSLLSSDDNVAVVEFDGEGRVLKGDRGQTWLDGLHKQELFRLANKVGNAGAFTDFRAGLAKASSLFDEDVQGRRKVILLLSDGLLEPNPVSEAYAPHHLSYMAKTKMAGRAERKRIYKEYQSILGPIARRIIAQSIVPQLKKEGVEVFTVALGERADRRFLQDLARQTSKTGVEMHAFYAKQATDLVGIFTQLLPYWTDLTVLRKVGGDISVGEAREVFLDEFVRDPHVLTLIDGDGTLVVQARGGAIEQEDAGTHSMLRSFTLKAESPPATWSYRFSSGSGTYEAVWIGKNVLRMVLDGLQSQYEYGEVVRAKVSLMVRSESAEGFLSAGTRLSAQFTAAEPGRSVPLELVASPDQRFQLEYSPKSSGVYTLLLTVFARDKQGREICPRPSLKYQFEVLPSFYVQPKNLDFGKPKKGSVVTKEIEIHSGLTHPVTVSARGDVIDSSNRRFHRHDLDVTTLPRVITDDLVIEPASARRVRIEMHVPGKAAKGVHEGSIVFQADSGETSSIDFRVHIPSLWEHLRLPLLLSMLVLLAIVGYLTYIWGCLGSPSGVLVPVSMPEGILIDDIRLSQVRRGFFSRWLNWKRNRLRIRAVGGDFPLDGIPWDLYVDLVFFKWSGPFVKNASPEGSAQQIWIEDDGDIRYERGPGESLGIGHEWKITLGEYTFRYENY